MNPIKQSIWFLLTYSKLFLIVLSVFAVFTIIINIIGKLAFIESMSLNLQMFIFLGVFLGGSLVQLKRNYLWSNNRNYKNSILHAYIIITVFVSVCFIPFLWTYAKITPLILAMPFCISIFASHLVLGKNFIYKILIPAIPFVIFQISKLGFGLNTTLLIIVITTLGLILFMYKNIFYQYNQYKKTDEQGKANSVAFMTTGLSHKHLNKINGVIGVIISKWILYGKRKIVWSVLLPHSRLAIITLVFYVGPYLLFASIADAKIQKMIGLFSLMILPNLFLALVMESRNLLKQTKFFAHVFTGDKHRQLKNKILITMDKNMLINAVVFVASIFLIIKLLSINVVINSLLISMVAVVGISLAIYPVLMCLSWINISVLLIIILFSYGTILYKVITWIFKNPQLVTTLPYILMFVTACLLLRAVAQYVFWQRPMEALLSNK